MKFVGLAAATIAAAALTGAAEASPTFGSIPQAGVTNEVLDSGYGISSLAGWFGATLYLAGTADIEATLIGYEAGNTNTFSFGSGTLTGGGGTLVNTGGIGTPLSILGATSGMLSFSFCTNVGNECVANGSNPDNTVPSPSPGVNFFLSFDDPNHPTGDQISSGKVVYLFFDDDGANNDDNHDDLVVRLAIVNGGTFYAPVPVPAGGLLLLGGLAGLAALRRRKRAA